jgi:hypothetical protein
MQLAWSGLGLVRNCCGGDTHIPEVFTRTLASVGELESMWDFSRWVPNAVVINLGTNDGLDETNPGDIENQYQQEYIEFVRNISAWYSKANGGAGPTVFLACGPMSEAYCPYVFNVIAELTVNSKEPLPVYFLDQRKILNSTNQCCGHPDADADATIAEVTISVISEKMQWN